jgi:hypothetical protein
MSTVSFGKRNRIRFTTGGALKEWQPSSGAAVYAVTFQPDAVSRPKAHSVVYFGETADLSKQFEAIRERFHSWWDLYGGDNGELYIFCHEMPGSSQDERMTVQHQLVLEYEPRGND